MHFITVYFTSILYPARGRLATNSALSSTAHIWKTSVEALPPQNEKRLGVPQHIS